MDEITRLVAGSNGGWNPNDGNGNYNGYSGALMTDTRLGSDVVQPSFATVGAGLDSRGMSHCTFVNGSQWKAWDESLFVGFLAGEDVWVVPLNPQGTAATVTAEQAFAQRILTGRGRIRSLQQGPDGHLYVVTNSTAGPGSILRVIAR